MVTEVSLRKLRIDQLAISPHGERKVQLLLFNQSEVAEVMVL